MCTEEIKCNKVACKGEGIDSICEQHYYVQFVMMLTKIKVLSQELPSCKS
jgi:glutathione peroxidase-family protein